MLEEEKKKILADNYVLKKRKDAHMKTIFRMIRKRCFLLGIFFGLIFLLFLYFVSSCSNIYHIAVEGNVYLKDEDIIELSGLSEATEYLLTLPKLREEQLNKSVYIENAKVEMLDYHLVRITVEEVKEVGYIYEDGLSQILLVDGSRIELDDGNYYLIEKVPLIEGYSKDQLNQIIRGFKAIDYQTINEISEIHRYPFSYDENMMEVIMRDGNYCFVSWTGLKMLNEYYTIVSGIDKNLGKTCIYLDELTNSGYTSICPWQETKNEEEDNSTAVIDEM